MPRVGDLSKCKIYKITSLTNPELVYYGHTCQRLSQRFSSHKSSYNTSSSKIIIDEGDAIILLVEDYPCETEDQATAREAFYVQNNPCVNKYIPGRTHKEYYEINKEKIADYNKEYREINKEQIIEQKKIYYESYKERKRELYEKNKEDIKKINKAYQDNHKEEIKEKKKLYCELHKEELKEYQKQYRLKKKLEKNI
jgi:hypothetical protein